MNWYLGAIYASIGLPVFVFHLPLSLTTHGRQQCESAIPTSIRRQLPNGGRRVIPKS
jgi:hypothetical protein